MKIIATLTNPQKLLDNKKASIKEYSQIDKYGFPFIRKIPIISKFPKIVST